jgi:hypothetical protein
MNDERRIHETTLRLNDIAYLCGELVRCDPTMATVKLKTQTDKLADFATWLAERAAAAQLAARKERNAERDDAA